MTITYRESIETAHCVNFGSNSAILLLNRAFCSSFKKAPASFIRIIPFLSIRIVSGIPPFERSDANLPFLSHAVIYSIQPSSFPFED